MLEQETLELLEGDVLAICTDGYSDAEGPGGEPFGEQGVAETLRLHAALPAREIIQQLEVTVEAFASGSNTAWFDDRTAIVVKR